MFIAPLLVRRSLLVNSVLAATVPPGFEPARVEGIGGGFDVLADNPVKIADVPYPPFLNGTWSVTRRMTSIEGDAGQAAGAWRLLGGYGDIREPELYETRFIDSRVAGSITGLDGRKYYGVVLDRGFELNSRAHGATVVWDPLAPNTLRYDRAAGGRGSAAELKVVQRSVELPDKEKQGWGSNELLRIATNAGTVFGDFEIYYAVRVQRRFRRGLAESGDRLVDGIEIVKTYRVLDGVAGIEMPTSTTKSVLSFTRV